MLILLAPQPVIAPVVLTAAAFPASTSVAPPTPGDLSVNDAIRLSDLKRYLYPAQLGAQVNQTGTADQDLQALITSSTMEFLKEISLTTFAPRVYNEIRNGKGATTMALQYWPVISFVSLKVNTAAVPLSSDGVQSGFMFDATLGMLSVVPGTFAGGNTIRLFERGRQNINLSYIAGFGAKVSEAATVPDATFGNQVRVSRFLDYVQDFGVSYSPGAALTLVTTIPTAGQYALIPGSPGLYQFAAADQGLAISISYTYKEIPQDIKLAVLDWCAWRWRMRQHIDKTSEAMAGQTTAYAKERPPATFYALDRYRKRFVSL